MKFHLHNRIAALYPGESFGQTEELQACLKALRIEFKLVSADMLSLPIVVAAGQYPAGQQAVETQSGQEAPPKESCLLFAGLKQARLDKALKLLREKDIKIDYKAVLTPENEGWSFGTLIKEMRAIKAEQTSE